MENAGAQGRRSTGRTIGDKLRSIMSGWKCPESPAGIRGLFDRIARYYDFANQILSLGLQHRWRRRLLEELLEAPLEKALDVCTGTGALLGGLGSGAQCVFGLDFSAGMLRRAAAKGGRRALLVRGDALALPFRQACMDAASAAFGVRSFSNLEAGLSEMLRILKPGGKLGILEFGQPECTWWRAAFWLYAHLVIPLGGRLISGDCRAYKYLTKSVLSFPCGRDFVHILQRAGACEVKGTPLAGGIVYLYTGRKSA